MLSDPAGILMVAISEVVSLFLLFALWRRPSFGPVLKLFWSIVLLLPVLGPLFYLAFSQFPASWPESKHDTNHDIVPHNSREDSD